MHPDAELLSSYLDGELGAAERAAVERLLTEDASARELMADLRALCDDLTLVPQHRLPEEFATEVLRSAERLMLLGPGELTTSAPKDTVFDWVDSAPRVARRHLWSSPAWFITGAAAAVLLMVSFGPWRGGPANVVAHRAVPQNGVVPVEPVAAPDLGDPRDNPGAASPTAASGNSTTVVPSDPADDASAGEATASPTNHQGGTVPDTGASQNGVPAFTGTAEEEQAPFGLVVTCQMAREAIAGREFDSLLGEHGIAVPQAEAAQASVEVTSDIVYVEATPSQLDGVFAAMGKDSKTYHSPIMQLTLGMFRDPTLWSEMLDAGQGANTKNGGEAAAANKDGTPESPSKSPPGSRAIHITPDAKPAKPLVFEKATLEELMDYGAELTSQFPVADEAADDQPPVVDNGLVRAVFFLSPLPAADAAVSTP